MNKYIPGGLDADIIKGYFNQTLATRQSKNVIKCVLFQKEKGFPNDSKPIFFDKDLIEHIKPALEFIVGQLKDVHEQKDHITPQSATKRYDNITWIKDQNSLLSFLHLACAARLIAPIDAKTSNLKFLEDIYPTIDVFDSNFKEWEKENKPKILRLIKEKNGGQEPTDN